MTQTDIANIAAPPERFNFAQHLMAINAERAAKAAFIDDAGTLSYGDFADRVKRLAAGLRGLGLKREERVLLLMQDGNDWPVSFLGAMYAGVVPVAVNTLLTADDYAYMLEHSRAQAVREIVHVLCNTNERTFAAVIDQWHEKWNEFLKERTVEPLSGRWHYTHKRLRSAYHSLRLNLPYLFTYQKYPELNIPNTTNSLDGSFAHLKGLIQIHRGLKIDLKRKLVLSILQNRHRKK